MSAEKQRADLDRQLSMVRKAQGDMNYLCLSQGQGALWQIEDELREVNRSVENTTAWCELEIPRAITIMKMDVIRSAILGAITSLGAIMVEVGQVVEGTWVDPRNS